ncbi:Inherit from COG: Methyltransferase [Seminavis robusta]|uniref:Inherit from COG: Methyltransferase n=1 Tax=Seminavis robusta TaxID=568900 RepID=A0A9N8DID3_9STRA|nr:Inherit from COG: Methyltransferase [Seminavis robusta]|eukprot:Sro161_g072370.1 Inherit from COG: Methyltransferase (428) ;mRNA; f:13607-14966
MARMRRHRSGGGDDEESAGSSPGSGSPVLKLAILVLLVLAGVTLASQSKFMGKSGFNATIQQVVNETLAMSTSSSSSREMAESTTSSSPLSSFLQPAQPALVDPGKYAPFSCLGLLHDMKNSSAMKAKDPNNGMMHARRTETDPPFYISLHRETFDKTRWCIMQYGHYYERELTKAFVEVLKASPPGSRILDVGANIGFFSLVSAAQGSFFIDSFEPNLKNRMRFCESLNMNRWTYTEFNHPHAVVDQQLGFTPPRVNLYPYGVGKEEGIFMFQENNNPGQGAVVETKATAGAANSIQIVTLDGFAKERGWFDSRPHIAVMKVDVEGFEPSVIEGAKELLRSHMIRNIFMEVSVRNAPEREKQIPMIQYFTAAGYKVFKIGGWQGPNNPVSWPNDAALVNNVLDAAAKESAKQLNVWWTIQDATITA